jgi:hypothetical protein
MSAKATPGVHAFRLFGNPGNGNRRQSNCGVSAADYCARDLGAKNYSTLLSKRLL